MADDDEDLENLDLNGCKEKIAMYQAERERRREYTERLNEKLKALNNELSNRKGQLETMKEKLEKEQAMNKQLQAKRQQDKEREEREAAEEDRIRLFLEEVLHSKLPPATARTKEGFKTFDEKDLMVNKPKEEQKLEQVQIDTVLITHQPPNTDLQYQLTYRVNVNTTARKLRQDACMFWEVSEVEYVLKTLDNAKVQDDLKIQTFFKEKEEAHLMLVQKTPKNTIITEDETKNIKPKFGAAVVAKPAPSAKKNVVVAPSATATQPLHQQLKTMPGLWNFMSRRDEDVRDHLDRIKLRDIVFFSLLLFVTMSTSQIRRPPGREYYVRSGPAESMLRPHYSNEKGTFTPAFKEIKTMEHVWEWLQTTVPDMLMRNNSALRSYNYLMGPLRIRTQRIRPPQVPGEFCTAGRAYATGKGGATVVAAGPVDNATAAAAAERPKAAPGAVRVDECMPVFINSDPVAGNANTADLAEIKMYWEGYNNSYLYWNNSNASNGTMAKSNLALKVDLGLSVAGRDGRSSIYKPWKFTTAEESALSGTGIVAGHLQSYDPSGYIAEYNLTRRCAVAKGDCGDIEKLRAGFVQDMQAFQQLGWVDDRSRMLLLSFTGYNGNFDMWHSNNYMIEIPPNGLVVTTHDIWPFKPNTWEPLLAFEEQELFELDLTRMCIVMFIIYHMKCEVKFEQDRGTKCSTYFLSWYGLADVFIVLTALYCFLIRLISFGMTPTIDAVVETEKAYQAWHEISYTYNQIFIIEAALFTLLVYRIISFLRINRQVFVVWMAVKGTVIEFFYYAWVFVPVIAGFVFGAHALYGNHEKFFSTYTWSISSLIMLINGDLAHEAIYDVHRIWTLVFAVSFYLAVTLFLLNSFVAIIVDEYEAARVCCGYEPKDYNWNEWSYAKWSFFHKCLCLPGAPLDVYRWFRSLAFWNKLGEIKIKSLHVCKCIAHLKPIEIPDEEEGSDEEE